MSLARRAALAALLLAIAGCGGAAPGAGSVIPPSPTASAGNAATPTTSPAARPSASASSGGVPLVAYQRWSGERTGIGLVGLDGGADRRLRIEGTPGQDLAHPEWSRAGEEIAFDVYFPDPRQTLGRRVEPWIVGIAGGTATRLATCDLPCLQLAYPAFSPDGGRVALIRYDISDADTWGPSAVEILDRSTGERRTISETADGREAWYFPRWSPDGRRIVVVIETYTDDLQETRNSMALGVIDLDAPSSRPRIITPPDIHPRDVDWSWTTDRLLASVIPTLTSPMEEAYLVTMQADGSDPVRLMDDPAVPFAYQASWAPAGDTIVFSTRVPGGRVTIGTVAADGSGTATIEGDRSPRTHPRVQPTGSLSPGG